MERCRPPLPRRRGGGIEQAGFENLHLSPGPRLGGFSLPKRSHYTRLLGVLPPDAGITSAHMRTIITLAIEEVLGDLRVRIAMKLPAG